MFKKVCLFVAASLMAAQSFAEPLAAISVTDTTTSISNQLTPIGLVATAVLSLTVAVAAYKWIKRAL